MKLTSQELSAILAGLRLLQEADPAQVSDMYQFDDVDVLSDDAIDELCERLNCECELADSV